MLAAIVWRSTARGLALTSILSKSIKIKTSLGCGCVSEILACQVGSHFFPLGSYLIPRQEEGGS